MDALFKRVELGSSNEHQLVWTRSKFVWTRSMMIARIDVSCWAVRLVVKGDVAKDIFCTQSMLVDELYYCETKVLEKR